MADMQAEGRQGNGPQDRIPEQVLDKARENLLLMSRTANGNVDTSSSQGKSGLLLVTEGNDAASAARRNFDAAIEFAWEQRNVQLREPGDIRRIVETLARMVNRGILKEGHLIREENSAKHTYLPVEKLEEDMDWFYRSLFDKLTVEPGEPVEEAAFTEFYLNFRGHFFSDGCGKCSMASAAWVLMRRDFPLPTYRGGYRAFYRFEPSFVKGTRPQEEEDAVFWEFLRFYRGLW